MTEKEFEVLLTKFVRRELKGVKEIVPYENIYASGSGLAIAMECDYVFYVTIEQECCAKIRKKEAENE